MKSGDFIIFPPAPASDYDDEFSGTLTGFKRVYADFTKEYWKGEITHHRERISRIKRHVYVRREETKTLHFITCEEEDTLL